MKKILLIILLLFSYNKLDAIELDFSMKGSIDITLTEKKDNTNIDGAELTIYKIADAKEENNNLVYKYVSDITACSIKEEDLNTDNINDFISECFNNDITGISDTTINGLANFNNLDLGLYLVKQTNKVEGYSTISPYLVMIPEIIDNEFIYEVSSKPKTDVIRVMDLTIKKVWNTTTTNTNTIVKLPNIDVELIFNGEVIDKVNLSKENNWEYIWKDIEKSDNYVVKEIVPDGYTDTYQRIDNTIIITNTSTLVQTGNMPWLIILIGSVGILLVAISVIYNKFNEKNI